MVRISNPLDWLTPAGRRQRGLASARRHSLVVFTASERDIERLDVALGPCVPLQGRKRPLAGTFGQWTSTTREMEALFRVMAPDAEGPTWASTRQDGPGRLCVFGEAFVQPLAAFSRECQGKGSMLTNEQRLARYAEVTAAWVAVRGTPASTLDEAILGDAAWEALRSQAHGQQLYAWFGPRVPLSFSAEAFLRHHPERGRGASPPDGWQR